MVQGLAVKSVTLPGTINLYTDHCVESNKHFNDQRHEQTVFIAKNFFVILCEFSSL